MRVAKLIIDFLVEYCASFGFSTQKIIMEYIGRVIVTSCRRVSQGESPYVQRQQKEILDLTPDTGDAAFGVLNCAISTFAWAAVTDPGTKRRDLSGSHGLPWS